MDYWHELSVEQRSLLELGDESMRVLKRGETIERWLNVGLAVRELQRLAMEYARVNDPVGPAYRACWEGLSRHTPHLQEMDKANRSHALWMANHWDEVKPWLDTLAVNVRLELNHPRAVRRRFEAAHKVPDGTDKEPATRVRLQDTIVKLTEELDAVRKLKTSGAMPPGMSAEAFAEVIADQMATATLKRFISALTKCLHNAERQDNIEAKRRKG
jgi:hypothetical protein